MKNNIMIIVLVTIVALGVITVVIMASVLNNSEKEPPDSDLSSYSSEIPPDNSGDSEPNSDVHDPPESKDPFTSNSGSFVADGIIATANSLIGVPFVENGASPDGFDNSGFIYYVLRENDFMCPRGTEEQSGWGTKKFKLEELKPGDLVFYCNDDPDVAGFGGIYIGDGKMIACLMPGTQVKEIDVTTSYYDTRFYCGISLF